MKMKCTDSSLALLYSHDRGSPFLWEVILQEASRNHHILFENSYISSDEFKQNLNQKLDASIFKEAQKHVETFLYMHSLQDIKATIQNLTPPLQAAIYVLYLRLVEIWKKDLVSRLH